MSIRGSRSPDISAIEDRIISQTERAARIRAEAAEEARIREERLSNAMALTGKPPEVSKYYAPVHAPGRAENRVSRDPCTFCGVRADKHAEFGCKRWRG